MQRCKAHMVCREACALQDTHVVHTIWASPHSLWYPLSYHWPYVDVSSRLKLKSDLLFYYACSCLLLPTQMETVLTPARNYTPGFSLGIWLPSCQMQSFRHPPLAEFAKTLPDTSIYTQSFTVSINITVWNCLLYAAYTVCVRLLSRSASCIRAIRTYLSTLKPACVHPQESEQHTF